MQVKYWVKNCVTAIENENKKRIRDASRKVLQKYKKRRQQLRSLQKKGVKSSTSYFPGAFSESKEPDIPINEKKQKVQKIPLTIISDDQIPQLHVHEQ